MYNTLIINAHPNTAYKPSYANQMQTIFEKKFKTIFPNESVDVLNLCDQIIPRLETDGLLGIRHKQEANVPLNDDEMTIIKQSDALLTQFMSHHRIVIVSPLHNFNITSHLKDYIDNILIANKTFRYNEIGSEGLMTDNYKVLYLQSSGGIYTENDRYTPLEFSHYYLKEIFINIMSFNNYYVVRAQGTDISPVDSQKIMSQVEDDLSTIFEDFYAN